MKQWAIDSEAMSCSDEGLTLEMSASLSLQGGNSTLSTYLTLNFSVSIPYRRRKTGFSFETNLSLD